MIKINIDLDDKQIIKLVKIEGHSNYAEKGKDIVCAAVSILVYSAYLALFSLHTKVDYKDDVGGIHLLVMAMDPNVEGECRGISLFLLKGFKGLMKEYRENISLNVNA